jgi:hypothetical protein
MFNVKALVARSLTVVGKSLTLLVISFGVFANEAETPRFFDYTAEGFVNRTVELSFGWFRTLSVDQTEKYYAALNHAVMFAENGQTVRWYHSDASGAVTPVMTWPISGGYCRQLHIQAIAYSQEKIISETACYNDISTKWAWINR